MIRELEMVEGDMINVLYRYNKLGAEQLRETMSQVAAEHHSRYTGPVPKQRTTVRKKKRGNAK